MLESEPNPWVPPPGPTQTNHLFDKELSGTYHMKGEVSSLLDKRKGRRPPSTRGAKALALRLQHQITSSDTCVH